MSLYKKNIGKIGEKISIDYLQKKNFIIIERNFRCRLGEIDIIARTGDKISFIEVKTRIGTNKGKPYESVNKSKLWHIKRTANYFLLINEIKECKLSVDIISIVLNDDLSVQKLDFFEGVEF